MKLLNIMVSIFIVSIFLFNPSYGFADIPKKSVQQKNISVSKAPKFKMKGLYIGQHINDAKKHLYKLDLTTAQMLASEGSDPKSVHLEIGDIYKGVFEIVFGEKLDKVFSNGMCMIIGDTDDKLAVIVIMEYDFESLFNTTSTGKKFFKKFVKGYKLKGEISYGKLNPDSGKGWNLKTKDGFDIFYSKQGLVIFKTKSIGEESFN